ncbi:MAG: winged helix-turn-helix transcriptional regulator [Pseudomonadales bacterium]
MARKRFSEMHCPVARALDEVGDWWSLLIIRDAMIGTRRFVDFARHLGIARNILQDRLNKLVDNDILQKIDVGEHGVRHEYELTDKGRDLFVVITALKQWGDKWAYKNQRGFEILDKSTQQAIKPLSVQSKDGKCLGIGDIELRFI